MHNIIIVFIRRIVSENVFIWNNNSNILMKKKYTNLLSVKNLYRYKDNITLKCKLYKRIYILTERYFQFKLISRIINY